MRKLLFYLFLSCVSLQLSAKTAEEDSVAAIAHEQDSIIQSLRNKVEEMTMQQVMLLAELERTGRIARLDSMAQAERQHHIDSLRQITKGAPVVVDGDTLLVLYAQKGGMTPEARAALVVENVEEVGQKLTFNPDSLYIVDGDIVTDIMAGDKVIMSITDIDGLWQNSTRQKLAESYIVVIQEKINELHEDYGLKTLLTRIFWAVLLIILQLLLIRLTRWLFRRYKFRFTRNVIQWLKPLLFKDYEVLNTHRQGVIVITVYDSLRILLVLLQLMISIPLLFIIFPETKTFTLKIIGYILDPIRDILTSVVAYIPNLFKIAIICLCFRYLVRFFRYLAGEMESGRLRISGFYSDWAMPTFYILRVLLYSLMLVMIWPLLPNSNSEIFQGVSVFIGIIVSLGSTTIIGNMVAGMVMTYMRPFHIGDYIKVGDTVGEVIEKTVLVTRIRTRKNEVVTIQNSSLMGSQTSNFTVAAETYGLIVHTKVTIGYDVPWQLIQSIMEKAAADTPGIKKHPKPFMMTTSLDDFYVEYEINAFTSDAKNMPRIYSELHQNLLHRFFEAGVEIMSPHIYARRDGIDVQIPPTEIEEQAQST